MSPMASDQPPYVAVIFSSTQGTDTAGYAETADRMEALARDQPGYLGIESARDPSSGFGITVSYWRTEQDAAAWKQVAEHLQAQRTGRERWYERYTVRVATVHRAYSFDRASVGPAYSFGTNDRAAQRLVVLAEVFAPTMVRVLAELPERRWSRVADLGCGPGSSTAHLLQLLDVEAVWGLDSSPDFVDLARARVQEATFQVADVTERLPVPEPDLLYARFLLSHLPEPPAIVDRWIAQLAEGGFLVLEEPEQIHTEEPAFRDHLDLVGALVASRGATMLVGPELSALDAGDDVVVNRTVTHPVAPADAARMFRLNLLAIRDDPWLRSHSSPTHVDDVVGRLATIEANPDTANPITWQIRQVVLTRKAAA